MDDLLEVSEVSKVFRVKSGEVRAVDKVSLKARKGEVTVILGPSGSGKTTLLYLIGSLERPDEGRINAFGEEICRPDADLVSYRRKRVGFVFQTFNLIPSLTALENVTLPMDLDGVPAEEQRLRAEKLLAETGIEGRLLKARASRLSGGEKQRVAIARALANDPDLILADEPTGNLDSATGRVVVDILAGLARREGKCVLIVTHDEGILRAADWAYQMRDGRLRGIEL